MNTCRLELEYDGNLMYWAVL